MRVLARPAGWEVRGRPTIRLSRYWARQSWYRCTLARLRVRPTSRHLRTPAGLRFCSKMAVSSAKFRFRHSQSFMRCRHWTACRIGKSHSFILGTHLRPRCSKPVYATETVQRSVSSAQLANHYELVEPLPKKLRNSWPKSLKPLSNLIPSG